MPPRGLKTTADQGRRVRFFASLIGVGLNRDRRSDGAWECCKARYVTHGSEHWTSLFHNVMSAPDERAGGLTALRAATLTLGAGDQTAP